MSLSHDTFQFQTNNDAEHGVVRAVSPHDLQIVVGRWFGTKGESHLLSELQGRDLACELTLMGYNTPDMLQTDLTEIENKAGTLTGTLTETDDLSATSRTWQQCTFLGIQEVEPMFLDGSGVNGWVFVGNLLWRQRIIND